MGRRKIEIRPIQHERNRAVTFLKRKTGLFKKAYELSVLCSIDIAVIIFEDRPNSNGKCYEFSSNNVKDMVDRYVRWDGETDSKGVAEFAAAAGNNNQDDDDDDDDDPYGRKRSASMGGYIKSTGGSPITLGMNPEYPMVQPPMSVHPSLPGYPQHGVAKRPRNEYHPYQDTNYRRSPYGSPYYGGSPGPGASAGPPANPYPSAAAPPPPGNSQYDYATRPARSSSTSALPGASGDFRPLPAPGGPPSFGGIVSTDESSRPGTTVPTYGIEWSASSDTHSHPPSSTTHSPAMGHAQINPSAAGNGTGPGSNDSWMSGSASGNIFDGNRRADFYGRDNGRPPSATGIHSRNESGDNGVKREGG